MTRTEKTSYTTPGNHNLHTPSREEFHRYHSNKLDLSDFYTDYTNGYQINKTASAIRMTLDQADKKNFLKRSSYGKKELRKSER